MSLGLQGLVGVVVDLVGNLLVCTVNIQIETSILPQHVHSAISFVETRISEVKILMIENKFQLNDEKTEYLHIRPNICAQNLSCTSLLFGHIVFSFSTTAINLGFHFPDDM